MDIKEKITEWQRSHINLSCVSPIQVFECEKELELVLFAIDRLTAKMGGGYSFGDKEVN